MRVEREDDRRADDSPRFGHQRLDQPRVAQVDPVEVADGHGPAAQRLR
jgi:hypothetical protein